MSRGNPGETYLIRPTNNIYTVLVLVALLVAILAEVAIFTKAKDLFPTGGLLNSDETPSVTPARNR